MSATENDAKHRPAGLRSLLAYVAEFVCISVIYFAVAKLSLLLASIHPSASPIWPPTGLALAAMLLLGYRISPAIFVGALIANLTTAGSLATSLAIAAGNTLESLVGAYLINRWSGGVNTFNSPGRVARFALICFVPSTVISATLGVSSLSLAGYADWGNFGSIWTTWWMGDFAGALVIAPAIVLWGKTSRSSLGREELVQSGLVYAAAIGVGLVAFSPLLEQTASRTPLAFLAILPLMWAALRRHQRDTATTVLLLSGFAVWGAISNGGPFLRGSLNESFLLLVSFMISVSLPSLALSAEVAVRKRDQEHLDFVMREMSHRSKNMLLVVQSMANQVARRSQGFDDFIAGFTTRLRAYADTHDLLVMGEWQGTDIRDLIRVHLAPFHPSDESAVVVEGPRLKLNPKAAENIGLALHELGTNAAKHGALSVATGVVTIRWDIETDDDKRYLRVDWEEKGGPRVAPPQRQGFGDLVITKIVSESLLGTVSARYEPDGFKWVLRVPSDIALA